MKQRKIEKIGGVFLLPPKDDVCQICATKHKPEEPHNQKSLYYHLTFHEKHGRYPTWEDALRHCKQEIKDAWEKELRRRGEWLDGFFR